MDSTDWQHSNECGFLLLQEADSHTIDFTTFDKNAVFGVILGVERKRI